MKHGEILQHEHIPGLPNPDPTMIYQGNLRTAKATDVYISAGGASPVSYTPAFTYHGFRFVEVCNSFDLILSLVTERFVVALWVPIPDQCTRSDTHTDP